MATRRARFIRHLGAIVAALSVAAIGIGASQFAARTWQERIDDDQASTAEQRRANLVDAGRAELTDLVRLTGDTAQTLTADLAAPLPEVDPSLSSLAQFHLVERVPGWALNGFVQQTRAELGQSDFRVTPGGARLEHQVVSRGTATMLGRDLAVVPDVQKQATDIASAAVVTAVAMPDALRAVSGLSEGLAPFAIVAPVFAAEGAPEEPAARAAAYRGYVVAVPYAYVLAQDLGQLGEGRDRVEIFLGGTTATEARLATAGSVPAAGADALVRPVEYDGRTLFTLRLTPTDASARAVDDGPRTLQLAGLVGGALLGLLVWTLLSRRHALITADEAMDDVARQRAQYHQLADRVAAAEARVDPLTGLLSKTGLAEHVAAFEPRTDVTALLVELGGSNRLNDGGDGRTGDLVRRAVARRLLATVRQGDLVARTAGDEFLVIGRDLDEAGADLLAGRLASVTTEPLYIDGLEVRVAARVGVARSNGVRDLDGLVRAARAPVDTTSVPVTTNGNSSGAAARSR